MADKTAVTNQIKFEWLFYDGDTRTFAEDNPKATITENEIRALETLIRNEGGATTLLIGDKAGAEFYKINAVVKETKYTTTLDLGLG